MTNSGKMTLEEKVVQKIKSDTLMAIVGDEDAILELAKRAIKEALYQPQRRPRQYGGYEEYDSVAIEAARDTAKKTAEKVTTELVETLLSDKEFKDKLRQTISQVFPSVIHKILETQLNMFILSSTRDIYEELKKDYEMKELIDLLRDEDAYVINGGWEAMQRAATTIEKLREALKPFAEFACAPSFNALPDNFPMTQGSMLARRQVTAGEFKKALEVYNGE